MTKGNIFHHTIYRLLPAVAIVLSLAVISCTGEEAMSNGEGLVTDDQPVIVSAYVTESALTRVEESETYGNVTSGTYYLTYPTSNGMNTAEVEFGEDGYGRAMIMPGRGELTWKQIGNGTTSDRSLGLTNVSPAKHNTYNENNPYNSPIIFRDDEEQFTAGRYIPYGNQDKTNDILLASKSPHRTGTSQDHTSNYVYFELHHCMARVRVIVETRYNKESFEDPLEKRLEEAAKVDITNVELKPYSFTPYIGEKTTFTDVVAISKDAKFEGKINLLNTLDGVDDRWFDYGDVLDDDKDDDKNVIGKSFTTDDILLPPQQLLTDNNRPRLVITVKDENKSNGVKTYSGILPHIMFDDKENPLSLEFLAEHLLTIRTVISNDPPELIFMPVKVVEWVDWGEYDLTAKQVGIYSEEDFKEMMKYYNDYNATKLLQYGYRKGGKWVFNIFRNLEFDSSKIRIEGQMPVNTEGENRDYSFDFNTWFTVKVDGKEYDADAFKALLSGEKP